MAEDQSGWDCCATLNNVAINIEGFSYRTWWNNSFDTGQANLLISRNNQRLVVAWGTIIRMLTVNFRNIGYTFTFLRDFILFLPTLISLRIFVNQVFHRVHGADLLSIRSSLVLWMTYSRLKRKDELYAIEECKSYRLKQVSIFRLLRWMKLTSSTAHSGHHDLLPARKSKSAFDMPWCKIYRNDIEVPSTFLSHLVGISTKEIDHLNFWQGGRLTCTHYVPRRRRHRRL